VFSEPSFIVLSDSRLLAFIVVGVLFAISLIFWLLRNEISKYFITKLEKSIVVDVSGHGISSKLNSVSMCFVLKNAYPLKLITNLVVEYLQCDEIRLDTELIGKEMSLDDSDRGKKIDVKSLTKGSLIHTGFPIPSKSTENLTGKKQNKEEARWEITGAIVLSSFWGKVYVRLHEKVFKAIPKITDYEGGYSILNVVEGEL